mmetsp:Transcript_20444/g.54783  ORF Transcript_20444/g.54783 Transcript_20444/m.54783 type:complete len:143 (-) Transcript_20444:556-984(-)
MRCKKKTMNLHQTPAFQQQATRCLSPSRDTVLTSWRTLSQCRGVLLSADDTAAIHKCRSFFFKALVLGMERRTPPFAVVSCRLLRVIFVNSIVTVVCIREANRIGRSNFGCISALIHVTFVVFGSSILTVAVPNDEVEPLTL